MRQPKGRAARKSTKVKPRSKGEIVSTSTNTLHTMIPEFDPLTDNVLSWINVIESYASTFAWSDSMIRYQALNKLKGSAKMWYDSLLRNDHSWTTWVWKDWRKIILTTFQIKRNMFDLIKEIIDKKPIENQSLYEFFFQQKAKIDALNLNFSQPDIMSIILGNISDSNITASVEASNFQSCDNLAGFLHSRLYKPKTKQMSVVSNVSSRDNTKDVKPYTQNQNVLRPVLPSSSETPSTGQTQNRKPIECFNCGGNHKRIHCYIKCEFCGKKGHSDSTCYTKKKITPVKPVVQETKYISSSDSKDKFYKTIKVNEFEHTAFIDTGSSCSLISLALAKKFNLRMCPITSPITLQGFQKDSIETVSSLVTVNLKIDSVIVQNVELYVLKELSGCEILIGRNVTERTDIMYSRIGKILKFDYAAEYVQFCEVVADPDFVIDTDSQHAKLLTLFKNYKECVASSIKELGKVNNHEMEINLSDTKPVYFRPYRASNSDRKIIRDMVNELLEHGIIRESNSPYASPALLVSKKNGEKRLCIDYRALNKITIKDKYPMPRIEELIDRLQGCKFFTSLDLKSGYYQIKMKEDSVQKTAFITEDGHYEFLRLPFGLANAPSTFQQMMNRVLGNLRFGKIIVYLDDILIVSETAEENLEILETVLKLFRENGLTLNLKKCHFLKTEIEFLGYKVGQNCIMPSESKVKAVKDFPTPKTVHQLRQFNGLISYFRKFIKSCALISSPLTQLTRKDSSWSWDSSHEHAFQALKDSLTSDSVLSIFDPKKECVLYTDASREGIAGILMQVTVEGEKPIHYYSRQTSDDEKKYHSFELELLAIVASLEKFRLYLLGTKFKIVTDCNSVRYALTKQEIVPRIARWVLSTQEFTFDIVHREGTRMQHVDALSRNPAQTGEKSEAELVMSITEADWLLSVQLQDSHLVYLRQILESGDRDGNKDVFTNYELLGNKIYRRTAHGRRWVVPKECVWQIIKCNHDDLGHFSLDKTYERIAHLYWFPKMRRTIKKYIKNCLNCIYYKKKGGSKEGELYPVPKYAQPFHTLHLDHLGPFVKTLKDNKYLLVTVDSFSKFVFVSPVKSTESSYVVKELETISKIFGNPRRIVADAGSAFTSVSFKQYCNDKNIRLHTIASGMPRSNGQVERFNRTVLEAMKTMGANLTDDRWDECVRHLQQGINSTFQKTIKAIPSEVFFGYRLRTDSDKLAPEPDNGNTTDVTQLRKWVDDNIKVNAELQKRRFDSTRTRATQYQEGDLVLVKILSQTNDGQSKKLMPVYKGPFQIEKILGQDRYRVTDMRGSERSHKRYTGTAAAENMKHWIRIDDWN